VIASGTSKVTGRPFNLIVAFEGGASGRALAHASFHHFADYNWDPSKGCPTFVTDPISDQLQRAPERLADITRPMSPMLQSGCRDARRLPVTHERVVIRDMRHDELDAIRHVTLAAYGEYAAIMPEPLWLGYRRQLLATLETAGQVERIVAERAGSIAGSVLLFPPATNAYGGAVVNVDYPEVRLLAVVPEARGHGIGVALMEECARRARRAGAAALGLHTIDMMRAAVRMYERLGYVRTPAQDFSPAPGVLIKGYRLDLRG
jgi:ribosomal protein S18 acetylase RimI-like enzyme